MRLLTVSITNYCNYFCSYCSVRMWLKKERNIPVNTSLFDKVGDGSRINDIYCSFNKMLGYLHVNSSGQITPCPQKPSKEAVNVFDLSPPVPMDNLMQVCPKCKNINDVETFLPADIMQKVEIDYWAYVCGNNKVKAA